MEAPLEEAPLPSVPPSGEVQTPRWSQLGFALPSTGAGRNLLQPIGRSGGNSITLNLGSAE